MGLWKRHEFLDGDDQDLETSDLEPAELILPFQNDLQILVEQAKLLKGAQKDPKLKLLIQEIKIK